MANYTNVSSLIGTQRYLAFYERSSSEPLVFTPATVNKSYNNSVTTITPFSGIVDVNVTGNGTVNTTWSYKEVTIVDAIASVADSFVTTAANYALFDIGSYYYNQTTKEWFFILDKSVSSSTSGSIYTIVTGRGLMGSTKTNIGSSDVFQKMNTIVMDSKATNETVGVITITGGAAVLAANDTISISDGVTTKVYTFVASGATAGEINVGDDVAGQMTNIKAALAADFTDYVVTKTETTTVLTQAAGAGRPITLVFACTAATALNAVSAARTTNGVSAVYDTGAGQIAFTQMSSNLKNGQVVYPSDYQ